jgi:hypothetical protein
MISYLGPGSSTCHSTHHTRAVPPLSVTSHPGVTSTQLLVTPLSDAVGALMMGGDGSSGEGVGRGGRRNVGTVTCCHGRQGAVVTSGAGLTWQVTGLTRQG